MTTSAALLLDWSRAQERSHQRELGMSEVGGCARRAGYRVHGVEPTDPGGSIQAALGSAIHSAIEQVYRDLQAQGVIPATDLIEEEVRFAGVLGHLDRYSDPDLYDTKTTSGIRLEQIRLSGPPRAHRWQLHLYAAGVARTGREVRNLIVDYLARDTGKDYQVVLPFDLDVVREALAWLRWVRETPLEMLPREYAPDSAFCRNCPFRSVCWPDPGPGRDPRAVIYRDDPDAAAWAAKLDTARADKADAEKREAEAKGALDALRPNDDGKSVVLDVGYPKGLQWTVAPDVRVDLDVVREEYAAVGAVPPMKTGTKRTLRLVPLDGAS